MTLVAIVLMLTAGHGLLRVAMGTWPHRVVGPLAAAGLAVLSGAVVIGLGTTYAGVSGLSTRPWPWLVPVLIVLSLAGALPPSIGRRVRIERGNAPVRPALARATLADGAVAAITTVVGGMALVGIQRVPVRNIDEWAIWAIRGRTLSLTGHLDPLVFHGVAANYQHLDYPLLVPSLIAWGDGAHGRINDRAAHVLLIGLTLAMLTVLGWAANRIAGPLAGVPAVLLVVGTPALMARWATLLTADASLVAFSVSLCDVAELPRRPTALCRGDSRCRRRGYEGRRLAVYARHLPRRGSLRRWRSAAALAAGDGIRGRGAVRSAVVGVDEAAPPRFRSGQLGDAQAWAPA